jgi:hypothetical protein
MFPTKTIEILLKLFFGVFLINISCEVPKDLCSHQNQRCNAFELFQKVIEEAEANHVLSYYGSAFFVSCSRRKFLFTVVDKSVVNEFIASFDLSIEFYCDYQDTFFLFVDGRFSKKGTRVKNLEIIDNAKILYLYEAYHYQELGKEPTLEAPPNFNPYSFLFKKNDKIYKLIDSGNHLVFP